MSRASVPPSSTAEANRGAKAAQDSRHSSSLPERAGAATQPWRPYQPTTDQPWNVRRVVHLHRRAGFAATWGELKRDLEAGPQEAVDRVIQGQSRDDQAAAQFAQTAKLIGDAAARSYQSARLKAWWVYRMLYTPHPLSERLALMWHNHFATSNRKVRDLAMMYGQNQLFRRLGSAPFGELLTAVVRDPAMLVWLDAPANHKGHPNENLARELMELFTLGIGGYGEDDIKQAARALTGWTLSKGEFVFQAALHDDGVKSVLGRRGHWTGNDILKMLLDNPATSKRLAWRLCAEFLGEKVAGLAHLDSLASLLRNSELNIGQAVATILRSELFFSDANIRSKVASPVEFVAGAMRAFEQLQPPPPTHVLADWIARLGQDLFYPPNVGGWSGGRAWLRTGALIGRSNFAVALASGRLSASGKELNWKAFTARHQRGAEPREFVNFVASVLFGGEPGPAWIDRVHQAASAQATDHQKLLPNIVIAAVASPEAQIS